MPGIADLFRRREDENPTPTPVPRSAAFVGTWAAADEDGDLFNLRIEPDGAAVSTWAKGKGGPRGERGAWRGDDEELLVSWDSGWRDRIVRARGEFEKLGYGPKVELAGAPTTRSMVFRVRERLLPWVGVWESPSKELSLLVLRSDGSAVRLGRKRDEGRWVPEDGFARITWADGSRSGLVRKDGDFELVAIGASGEVGSGVAVKPAAAPLPTPTPAAKATPAEESEEDDERRRD